MAEFGVRTSILKATAQGNTLLNRLANLEVSSHLPPGKLLPSNAYVRQSSVAGENS